MEYPYPELLSLLQMKCQPEEYQRIIAPFLRKNKYIYVSDERLVDPGYKAILPRYKYAQCPICNYELYSRADTYSLYGWQAGPSLEQMLYPEGYWVLLGKPKIYSVPENYPPRIIESDVFNGTQEFAHCEHFLGIHLFENLHQNPLDPIGAEVGKNFGEVPYVTRWFFKYLTPSYVVFHATPVCRNEASVFVPSYTIFSLSYFSEDRKALIAKWKEDEIILSRKDPEYDPALLDLPKYYGSEPDQSHDLAYFAKHGMLGFLDFRQSNLPLVIGRGTKLPSVYQNIKGRIAPFEWLDGKMKYW